MVKLVRLAVLFVPVFLASGFSFAEITGNHKFKKIYENSNGPVPFHHERHVTRFPEDCAFCHSALKTFGGKVNEMFAHKVCRVCHEKNNGPVECHECHGRKKATKQ